MPSQMKALFDATGSLWTKGALDGKPGAMFTGTASQGGGQETTISNCGPLRFLIQSALRPPRGSSMPRVSLNAQVPSSWRLPFAAEWLVVLCLASSGRAYEKLCDSRRLALAALSNLVHHGMIFVPAG